jgi:hypothetical protein
MNLVTETFDLLQKQKKVPNSQLFELLNLFNENTETFLFKFNQCFLKIF